MVLIKIFKLILLCYIFWKYIFFWFCVLYRQLEHRCEFSRVKKLSTKSAGPSDKILATKRETVLKLMIHVSHANSNYISILTRSFNYFEKKIEKRKNSFSGMKRFCQLRPMLGYFYLLAKLISYFLIHDVDFYCCIDFTQFKYSLIKIRFPNSISPIKKEKNHRVTKEFVMDSSTICQASPHAAYFLWSCDKVYHKQEVCFLLYFLGQIVIWQYNPYYWIKIDHVQLNKIMNDSCGTVKF